ncbi:MAG: hypothetical protein R6V44_07930 [Paracoccaceae bacterium]
MTDARALPPTSPAPTLAAYAVGLLAPALGAAAVAAIALAVSQPPLVDVTGIGRWTVFPAFAATSLGLSIWLVAGPTTALLLAGLRPWLPRLVAAGAAGALATLGLALFAAWSATRGEAPELLLGEVRRWGLVIAPFALGGALWLHLVLHFAHRRAHRSRR